MEVIITLVVLLLLLLAVIWGHYLRSNINTRKRQAKNVRDETNVRLYHEHKAEIEKDYAEGGIDEENYQLPA